MPNAQKPQRYKIANWWENEIAPAFYTFEPFDFSLIDQGLCDPSQLEPGVWLVPGHSTLIAPPSDELPAKQAYVWNADLQQWQATPDYRGEVRWVDKQFRAISSVGDPRELGIPDMVVHDAQYVLPDGAEEARIRMKINDDEIEFDDDPNLLERQILAAWEAQGETIRPIDEPETINLRQRAKTRVIGPNYRADGTIQEPLDSDAVAAVEGTQVPQPEEFPN